MFSTTKLCQLATMALVLSVPATALAAPKHPGYLRATDDLRFARALLQRNDAAPTTTDAQDEVSLTLASLDRALVGLDQETGTSQKKARAIPRIDPRMPWGERLTESLRLLEKAREECATEKENASDNGLRAELLAQLDQAHTRLTVAVQTKNFDYNARNLPTRND
jgi:hypothetical protein